MRTMKSLNSFLLLANEEGDIGDGPVEDFHDIPGNDPLVAANTDNVNETPALEDSWQYLSNVYDLLVGNL